MNKRSLPLGFLPGVVCPGTHCMLSYNKPDEAFINSVSKYIFAGIASGQMCVCVVLDPIRNLIKGQMSRLGISLTSRQFVLPNATDVYMPLGHFDLKSAAGYYTEQEQIAQSKWNGMRVFADASAAIQTRAMRIKILEYEAQVNSQPTDTTALCGYQASLLPRSYILQVKSIHPFIASLKSMRQNRDFCEPDKFLSGLYRFRRVDREYPATPDQKNKICSDLEEAAIRTMMSISDIGRIQEAVYGLFATIMESMPPCPKRSHIHLVLDPKPDKFSVILRYHRALFQGIPPRWSLPLACKIMDVVHIGECGPDTIITMSKRY